MRLFVAVPVSDAVRGQAARAIESLRPVVPLARWMPPQSLHVTLAFLGEVADPEPVIAAVDYVAASVRPLELTLGALGGFPSSRKARVVKIGLGGDVEALAALASEIGVALGPLGVAQEDRSFSAHLTIGRLREPQPLPDPSACSIEPVSFAVGEVATFRSHLRSGPPLYEELAASPLSGAS